LIENQGNYRYRVANLLFLILLSSSALVEQCTHPALAAHNKVIREAASY